MPFGALAHVKSNDAVECTMFAPPEISPGETSLIHLWLHTSDQAEDIARISVDFDQAVERRVSRNVGAPDFRLLSATRVEFTLKFGNLQVRQLSTELTWHDSQLAIAFRVSAPLESSPSTEVGEAIVSRDGIPLTSLKFKVRITKRFQQQTRSRKVFLSYSSKDSTEVLRRAQMLSTSKSRGDANRNRTCKFFQDSFEKSLRIVRHPDGLHIIGDGILCPINIVAEGRELIAAVRERRTLKTKTGA
jgi:hypothetical protein